MFRNICRHGMKSGLNSFGSIQGTGRGSLGAWLCAILTFPIFSCARTAKNKIVLLYSYFQRFGHESMSLLFDTFIFVTTNMKRHVEWVISFIVRFYLKRGNTNFVFDPESFFDHMNMSVRIFIPLFLKRGFSHKWIFKMGNLRFLFCLLDFKSKISFPHFYANSWYYS